MLFVPSFKLSLMGLVWFLSVCYSILLQHFSLLFALVASVFSVLCAASCDLATKVVSFSS